MMAEPAYRIERGKLSDVTPDPQNANRHKARGAGVVEKSLRRGKFFRPTAAFGKGVEHPVMGAGNLTQETLISIGVDDALFVYTDGSLPIVHVRTDVAPGSKEAQRLALEDNRSAELSLDWSIPVLTSFDADVLGDLWNPEELSALGDAWAQEHEQAAEDPGAQVDKAEELQAKWNVQPGDLFAMGDHRLLCGDCREPASWERLLSGVKANGVFTSPPYAEQRKEQYGGTPANEYVAWWEAVQANVKAHLAPDGSFFVNIKPHCENGERVLYVFDLVLAMNRQWGWRFVDELIWVNPGVPGRWPNRFKEGFESVFHFCLDSKIKFLPDAVATPTDRAFSGDGRTHIGNKGGWIVDGGVYEGMALPSNAIKLNVGNEAGAGVHTAAFPVALPDFFVRAYSDAGDVWLDPFCGSGTTIVAAHNNKRVGMGIEMLPKYCAVILERVSGLGITPILAQDNT
jgi:site-specific DNA-methyltransferase (adenine-specific)/site-specific DNA-methyltransferase (cytosine-N4-specific)